MGRGDRKHRFGEMVPDAGDRERAAPTMEDQNRTPRACLAERNGQVGAEVDDARGLRAHDSGSSVRARLYKVADIRNLSHSGRVMSMAELETLGRRIKQVQYR